MHKMVTAVEIIQEKLRKRNKVPMGFLSMQLGTCARPYKNSFSPFPKAISKCSLTIKLSSLSFFSIIIVITVTFFVIIIVNTVFVIIIVNTVFVIIILFSSPSSSYHRYSCCHYLCLNAMIHCNHHNCHNQYIVIETELPVRRGEGPEFEAFEDRETVPGPGFAYF